uniref:Potassium channel domain-containing protein n=1 Tax=Plectus sambesii TaxID=2011161 RepID=A0A914VST6_9BILA
MQSSATAAAVDVAAAAASTSAALTRRESLNDSIAAGNGGRLGTPSTSSLRDDPIPPSPTVTGDSTTMALGLDDCNAKKRLTRHSSTRSGPVISANANGGPLRRMMSFRRKESSTSVKSESRAAPAAELLHTFSRRLQKTHSSLKRTRLLHIFYMLALPVYTLAGAFMFQALDGEHDDLAQRAHKERCLHEREVALSSFRKNCSGRLFDDSCMASAEAVAEIVDACFRQWHATHRSITHPLSDLTNAIVYAFSVYTTIGYGNMAADTVGCRIATVFYGILGIPLFFAFVKEEGNLFRYCFISICSYARRMKRRYLCVNGKEDGSRPPSVSIMVERPSEPHIGSPSVRRRRSILRKMSSTSMQSMGANGVVLQRRIFFAGISVFLVYLLAVSAIFSVMADWDFFTAFYFLFNSVALIGFGDVFPSQPAVMLPNLVLIILGVVLFSMCYFILQEEIREKAFEASRRARMSISHYTDLLLNYSTRSNPWSRRNSPSLDPDSTDFAKWKKRRESAPAVTTISTGRGTPVTLRIVNSAKLSREL